MISIQTAQEILLHHSRSFGRERVPLELAPGRVLTETVRADRDYPPFNRAMMDGYALRYTDWEEGIRRYKVVETVFAGEVAEQVTGPGQCCRIMTGAAVPEGADLVIRREDVQERAGEIGKEPVAGKETAEEDWIELRTVQETGEDKQAWQRYRFIARQGEDLRMRDTVIDRPCICDPSVMGLLAALGKPEVQVAGLPGVALVTTGNEVVAVDAPVGPAMIRNSNEWLLQAALQRWGIWIADRVHLPDDRELLDKTLPGLLCYDLILLCGGVSAGDADHVPAALEAAGVQKLFHGVAIKPGKPVWCGRAKEGGMVFALPGNPFSCLVGFTLLVQPWLRACFGLPPALPLALPLLTPRNKRTPLDEFFPARIEGVPSGLQPVPLNSSGDIRLGLGAHTLAWHESGRQDLAAGDTVLHFPLG